ncbi:MAG: GNAT family N-acetyltransferase [Bacteroidaceae bacterium]|nr:GNAT family N-acetyltransferase [Bacteroidaceae bacterium]
MTAPLLQSPTVSLRPLESADLPLMYKLENDTRLWDTTSAVQPLSRGTIGRFINASTGDIYKDRQLRLVIEINHSVLEDRKQGTGKKTQASMPKASQRLSSAVGEAGADTERKSESEAANLKPQIEIEEISQTPTSVGFIDLTNFSPRHQRAEVGICLLPEYQQKRIGTEALRLMEDYAAQMLHIHQLYAYINPANEISTRLFSSAGYRLVGTLRDWVKTPSGYAPIDIRQKKIEKKQ